MYRVLRFANTAFPARCRCKTMAVSQTPRLQLADRISFLSLAIAAGARAIPTCYIISMNVAILRETRENDTVAIALARMSFAVAREKVIFESGFAIVSIYVSVSFIWTGSATGAMWDMLNGFQTLFNVNFILKFCLIDEKRPLAMHHASITMEMPPTTTNTKRLDAEHRKSDVSSQLTEQHGSHENPRKHHHIELLMIYSRVLQSQNSELIRQGEKPDEVLAFSFRFFFANIFVSLLATVLYSI